MRSLRDNIQGAIDLGVVLMIGISFAALMVIAFIIWTVKDQLLLDAPTTSSSAAYNTSYYAENATRFSIANVTGGFDDAVNLILVAITIFILAIAISALMMLRGR